MYHMVSPRIPNASAGIPMHPYASSAIPHDYEASRATPFITRHLHASSCICTDPHIPLQSSSPNPGFSHFSHFSQFSQLFRPFPQSSSADDFPHFSHCSHFSQFSHLFRPFPPILLLRPIFHTFRNFCSFRTISRFFHEKCSNSQEIYHFPLKFSRNFPGIPGNCR